MALRLSGLRQIGPHYLSLDHPGSSRSSRRLSAMKCRRAWVSSVICAAVTLAIFSGTMRSGLPVPSPAMTKAFLMNSARYLTGANANDALWSHAQGLGAIHLQTTFGMFSTPTLFRDQEAIDLFTATGQVRTINGTIHDPGKPLRITLAWTDAPGSTASAAWVRTAPSSGSTSSGP